MDFIACELYLNKPVIKKKTSPKDIPFLKKHIFSLEVF